MKAADRPIARELLLSMLQRNKDVTSRSIYRRIAPGPDGCIRSVLNPGGTETGRFSHSETFLEPSTNLGNMPKKAAAYDPLYEVRTCFRAPPGRLLGEADLSQAEARVAAYRANDPLAIEQYEHDIDRYRYLAAATYFGDPDKWQEMSKKDMRRQVAGKMGLLACQYGVGWFTLMNQINADADLTGFAIDAQTAKRIEGTFHELWPHYRPWHEAVLDEVLTRGYLINAFGRRRDFFARADTEQARAALRREAVAFLPQSDICDLLSEGILDLYENADPHLIWLHLQIHDAVIFSCKRQDGFRAARTVKAALERPMQIGSHTIVIPAEVSLSATSWDEAKEVA